MTLISMRWPNVIVSAQMKRVARDVTLYISKKVFVGRDAESSRSALPFDFKYSAGVDLGKGANCSVIRFDMAIASNANPSASAAKAATQTVRNTIVIFFMGNMILTGSRMQQRGVSYSRKNEATTARGGTKKK